MGYPYTPLAFDNHSYRNSDITVDTADELCFVFLWWPWNLHHCKKDVSCSLESGCMDPLMYFGSHKIIPCR